MKVLLINGSPKKEGCTYTALSVVAKALNEEGIETEIFHVGNKPIAGCMGCGFCRKTGKCKFDDTVNECASKAKEADGIIVGSPVHYASASGMITSFMDRLFFSSSAALQYKPAAVVASARRAGTTATLDQLSKHFTISNMPLVSSCYWNMVHGNTPEDVMQDLEGLQIMRTLGRNMAWLLKSIEAGKKAGVQMPIKEDKIKTSFIR
ncbi:MAG: flavodoxin family protein [Intestinibacter sp.]|uniref:flavodoxin family protein n=1 Tax=Intestinibacter sp. TaxID=1965304 RepID=UPI002A7FE93B|nr:flavodoxin family protein [Intestinibacter sp.]MDY4575151.1 flavodoxin family protein [Intestinibacter sp.]